MEIALVENMKDATNWAKENEQLNKRTVIVGIHDGKLNPFLLCVTIPKK